MAGGEFASPNDSRPGGVASKLLTARRPADRVSADAGRGSAWSGWGAYRVAGYHAELPWAAGALGPRPRPGPRQHSQRTPARAAGERQTPPQSASRRRRTWELCVWRLRQGLACTRIDLLAQGYDRLPQSYATQREHAV